MPPLTCCGASSIPLERIDSHEVRLYGRVSTEDQQDPQASKAWQLSRARSLVQPAGGEIVAEYFDIGLSRSLPWKRRPEALRLSCLSCKVSASLASARPRARTDIRETTSLRKVR